MRAMGMAGAHVHHGDGSCVRWPIGALQHKVDHIRAEHFRTEAEHLRCGSEISNAERRVSVSGASPTMSGGSPA